MTASAGSPGPACCTRPPAGSISTSRGRSSSAIGGTMSAWRARSARPACWCGPGTASAAKRPARPASKRRRWWTISRQRWRGFFSMRERERMTTSAPPAARLLELIDEFAGIRVAVFGDLLADEFIYGQIARVSREAPVLILDYDSTEIVPGGAGNAANNVAALGGAPLAIGVAGADETGRRLLEVL